MTEAELLASLQELAATTEPEPGLPEGHWTTEMLLRKTGIGKGRYYEMMHAVRDMGRLGVTRVRKTAMDERRGWTTAYCILPEAVE